MSKAVLVAQGVVEPGRVGKGEVEREAARVVQAEGRPARAVVPASLRTPTMRAAINRGVEFLLGRDPTVADYLFGYGERPSSSWLKFGYPIGYVTDVLQNPEVLAALGYTQSQKIVGALKLVESKQDASGF